MRTPKTPSYRLHKGTGLAVATFDGKSVYFGRHGTPESRARYEAAVARWVAAGRTADPSPGTVASLCGAYRAHADSYYRKRGDRTTRAGTVDLVTKLVEEWHGREPAGSLGPLKLDAMRRHWADAGLARGTINQYARVVVEMYRWGVSREFVPVAAWQALTTLGSLTAGRCDAREGEPVVPVPVDRVRAVVAVAPPRVADQIRLQLLTGMRSGELLAMRPCDIDRSGDVWYYAPPMFKTEHKVDSRRVGLGPGAQAIVSRWLGGRDDAFLFRRRSKKDSHDGRVVTPRVMHLRVTNYYADVERYCLKAWPCPSLPTVWSRADRRQLSPADREVLLTHLRAVRWNPHQLRHAAATILRAERDLEAARVALGHTSDAMTRRYAKQGDAAWKAEVAPGAVALDRAVAAALGGNISTDA
jgi:integrase